MAKTNIMYLCGSLGLCSLILIAVVVVIYLLMNNQESFAQKECKHKKGKKNWVRAPKGYQTEYGCDKIRYVARGSYKNNKTSWRDKGAECCVKLV
tara:strand:+ start:13500 stop:13784 length:285 start_codon:yes stop_codon:yes gene_type:complete